MTKEPKGIYNIIISIILGGVFAQIVLFEGYAIRYAEQEKNGIAEVDIVVGDLGVYKLLALIVFMTTLFIFNRRKYNKINLDKMSIYLILVVIISLIVSIEGMLIISQVIFNFFPDIIEYLTKNYVLMTNAVYMSVVIAVSLFLITFILLVNRKVKYIKFLTKEVKAIENEGFGKTIEVKGGDELADLCKSINSMSVELGEKIENEKRIENNKNELITNISHDLKTPLTSIVGYLELLSTMNIDEKTRKEYMQIAYNKSIRLRSLVNELFEYTKLAGTDMQLDKKVINISMLLNQAVGESIINFIDKDIEVILDNQYSEVFCNVDAVQILRVFENLIRNVEKYADPDSKFKVSLKIEDNKINISFINKCESIEEEDIKHLFERFYRQDKSRHKEGSGLGLAIVKRIIDLHGGIITAEKIDNDIKFNVILDEA